MVKEKGKLKGKGEEERLKVKGKEERVDD